MSANICLEAPDRVAELAAAGGVVAGEAENAPRGADRLRGGKHGSGRREPLHERLSRLVGVNVVRLSVVERHRERARGRVEAFLFIHVDAVGRG
jgi:hypothetical protein